VSQNIVKKICKTDTYERTCPLKCVSVDPGNMITVAYSQPDSRFASQGVNGRKTNRGWSATIGTFGRKT
jgi:hypothetical protein